MNRIGQYRFRAFDARAGLIRELRDQVRDQSGPAGLVRCATATAIVAVEVFMEQDVVLEMRIGLKFFVAAKTGRLPSGPRRKILSSRRHSSFAISSSVSMTPEPVGHSILRPS